MIIIFIRSTVTYIILLILMRLMGKRQIGEMQPFELVITLLIAELACIPMSDVSVPLIYGIVAIIAVFILHQIFSNLEQLSVVTKRIISGKPALVLNKNGVDFTELKRNNLGVEDLIESMRSAGYFSLDSLDYAIYESNGKLSVQEKQNSEGNSSLPLLIIDCGKIIKKNLKLINMTASDIEEITKKHGYAIKNIGVLTIDGNGKVYMQRQNEKYTTFSITLPEGIQW